MKWACRCFEVSCDGEELGRGPAYTNTARLRHASKTLGPTMLHDVLPTYAGIVSLHSGEVVSARDPWKADGIAA